KLAGRDFLLSHFPYQGDHTDEPRYRQWRLPNLGEALLHGHTHRADQGVHQETFALEGHVGLDAWDLTPVPAHINEQLIKGNQQWLPPPRAAACGPSATLPRGTRLRDPVTF